MEHSSVGRVIGALVSPGKTFRSIAERPTWMVALIVVIVAALAASLVVSPRVDWREGMEQQAQARAQGQEVPQEQLDVMVKVAKVMTVVSPIVFTPLVLLLVAAIFLGAFKLVGGEIPYKASLATTVHGFLPSVVGSLVTILVVLGRDSIALEELQGGTLVASNLAALAPEGSARALVALLASVDVFSLWSLVLFVIGYKAVGRVSTKTAAGVVVGLWVVWVLVKVGLAALFGQGA